MDIILQYTSFFVVFFEGFIEVWWICNLVKEINLLICRLGEFCGRWSVLQLTCINSAKFVFFAGLYRCMDELNWSPCEKQVAWRVIFGVGIYCPMNLCTLGPLLSKFVLPIVCLMTGWSIAVTCMSVTTCHLRYPSQMMTTAS